MPLIGELSVFGDMDLVVDARRSVARRSSLVLIREDVVGGKAVRRTYPCSLDETMANAGARPNARLAILIDEDEEDDE